MQEDLKNVLEKKLNDLRNSNYSLLITVDGVNSEVRNYIIDKMIDVVPPKYLNLCKKSQEDFRIKKYWVSQPGTKEVTIFNGSYMSDLIKSKKNKKLRNEVAFFETQMFRYKTFIVHVFADKKYQKFKDKFFENDLGTKAINIYTAIEDKKDAYEYIIDKLLNHSDFSKYIIKDTVRISKDVGKEEMPKTTKEDNEFRYTTEEDYNKQLKKYKDKIRKKHKKLIKKGLACNIVFQGIDAAGKSSTIRRLTSSMLPHMFRVHGFAKPSEQELAHHYLWRFWTKLPEKGEIVIYDRSWYERLTAERVLGITPNWIDGLKEIQEFEKEMKDRGILTIKLWFDIDKDTQLARFKERENNPLKNWKVSKSDYETREKWDVYQDAFAFMLKNTKDWHLIDSRNKKEARINTLIVVNRELKKFLEAND